MDYKERTTAEVKPKPKLTVRQAIGATPNLNHVFETVNKNAKKFLNIKPNHKKYVILPNRVYNSGRIGTAVCDGNGWYVPANS